MMTTAAISILAIFFVSEVHLQRFAVLPENTCHVLSESEPLYLNCTIDFEGQLDSTQWIEYITDPSEGITVTLGDQVALEYISFVEVEGDTDVGVNNLNFLPDGLSFDLAGKYECANTIEPEIRHSAELVLMDTLPVCTTNLPPSNVMVEGESLDMSCTVGYSGKWAPQMVWRDQYDRILPAFEIGGPGVVETEVFVNIVETDDILRFSCTTSLPEYLDPQPGNNEADNVCDFEHTFLTPDITVHYSPRDTAITPNFEEMPVGEILACNSRASPPVQDYSWYTEGTPTPVGREQTFRIPEDWLGLAINMTCIVANSPGDSGSPIEDQKTISFTVIEPASDPTLSRTHEIRNRH